MAITVGDKVSSATLYKMGADGLEAVTTDDYCACRKVVISGVPGAFTPTCSAQHVPGFMQNADALKAKAMDVELDLGSRGLGLRGKRFALVAEDGVVKHSALQDRGELTTSSAEETLKAL